ncbi:MAG: DsbA family protein [bacterium]|nr:DsbA family protein [bacterium]
MNNRKNVYLSILIITVALLIGGAIIYIQSSKSGDKSFQPEEFQPEESPGHVRGNPEAPVTIVEFSDFQCPFCQRFHPTMKQILENYPEDVRWVYKHFPLDSIHSQARPAAEASECVWEQKGDDGFWQFADGVFENQPRMSDSLYLELASNMSLDMGQFEECLSSGKYENKVETDLREGAKMGVRGTPGNFVNGEFVEGAASYEELESIIKKVLSNL